MKKYLSIALSLIMLFTTLAGASTTAFAKSNNTGEISQNVIISKWHICTLVEYKQPTCIKNGYKKYKCRFCKYTVKKSIAKTQHKYNDYIIKATPDKDGEQGKKCSVCKNKINRSTISRPKEIRMDKNSFVYTGCKIKPSVKVYDSNGGCISSSNYAVRYTDNVSVGKAKVTVIFSSDRYDGSLEAKFLIVKNTKNESYFVLRAARPKGFMATIHMKKGIKGYQLQYSCGPTFQSGTKTITKSVSATSDCTLSYTATKLKSLTKYYVRVRFKTSYGYTGWKMNTITILNY